VNELASPGPTSDATWDVHLPPAAARAKPLPHQNSSSQHACVEKLTAPPIANLRLLFHRPTARTCMLYVLQVTCMVPFTSSLSPARRGAPITV
jgi:hypothetical protein